MAKEKTNPLYLVQEEPLELGLDGVEEGAAQQVRRHRQVMLNQAQREHPTRLEEPPTTGANRGGSRRSGVRRTKDWRRHRRAPGPVVGCSQRGTTGYGEQAQVDPRVEEAASQRRRDGRDALMTARGIGFFTGILNGLIGLGMGPVVYTLYGPPTSVTLSPTRH